MLEHIILFGIVTLVSANKEEYYNCGTSNKYCEDKYGWGQVCNVKGKCEFSGWLIVAFVVLGCILLCCILPYTLKECGECYDNMKKEKAREKRLDLIQQQQNLL